jgi:ubiquinone/menaquinone biosynthesis C-methylase UbiE
LATVPPSSAPSVLDPEGAHLAALLRVADFTGARVLEVGCGDGRLTVGVAERAASVWAFDPAPDAVVRAQDALPSKLAGRVTYATATATALEIPKAEYDIVLFSWSL